MDDIVIQNPEDVLELMFSPHWEAFRDVVVKYGRQTISNTTNQNKQMKQSNQKITEISGIFQCFSSFCLFCFDVFLVMKRQLHTYVTCYAYIIIQSGRSNVVRIYTI